MSLAPSFPPSTGVESESAPQLLGRYRIVSKLGQGAMGAVYKAVDPLIERTVAIKAILLDLSSEERALFEERFYREAKSAGQLNHPNIVTIYDVGEVDNIAYIAMEYLEGLSLAKMIESGVDLAPDRVALIIAEIADGLSYAHERGIVHRDIKPANIVITRNGIVKITDFGIALLPSASRTQPGLMLGSPKYMSPEQVMGKPLDSRSDIFSLGIVLYELLTGKAPFNGDNLAAMMYEILHRDPTPPSAVNPAIPPVFDHILTRALAKNVEQRYQHGRDLARDLRGFQDAPVAAPDWANAPSRSIGSTAGANAALAAHRPAVRHSRRLYLAVALTVAAAIGVVLFMAKPAEENVSSPASPAQVAMPASLPAPPTEGNSSGGGQTVQAPPSAAELEVIPGQPGRAVNKPEAANPLAGGREGKEQAAKQAKLAEINAQLEFEKRNLDTLRLKYTNLHPDVIAASRAVRHLETQKRQLTR